MIVVLAGLLVIAVARGLQPRHDRPIFVAGPVRSDSAGRCTRLREAATSAARAIRVRRAGLASSIVADWCSDLARSIRSGAALRTTLEQVVPANEPLRQATDPLRLALARGRSVSDATELVSARGRGHELLGLTCSVLAVCGRSGGSAAAPLDRVAATLRRRAADDQERAAHAAQARLSAHVLTLLPLGVLGLLVVADGDVRAAVASPGGATCVLVGVGLNVAGWIWMRRIIRGAEQ